MPTGYTAGILDGTITTFPQFAKQCMRAFGATIHMRDDDIDAEYIPRIVSNYHTEKIEEAKQLLKDAEKLSDETIIINKKKQLEESKAYYEKRIEEAKTGAKIMNGILKDIRKWHPPTPKHVSLKDFMIDQIIQTIDFDCKTDYHEKNLIEIEMELLSINANKIRKEMKAEAKKDFEYHTKEYNADVQRCNQANQWVTDLLESLP